MADETPQVIPVETWCKTLSFIVRSHCLQQICPVSRFFRNLVSELLSWEGAAVYVRAVELEEQDGRPRFDPLIPTWSLCDRVFADFKDAHMGKKRKAARRCFALLGQHCTVATGLFLRNWCLMERDGLQGLCSHFPAIRHLELSGCDFLGQGNCARLFAAHPALLSFRATFAPKAVMTAEVVEAAPRGLKMLGFTNFKLDGEVLRALLDRCALEHLWLARTAGFSDAVSAALSASPHLVTLSLPETLGAVGARGESPAEGNAIAALVRACPKLDTFCCWGEHPELAQLEEFERIPCSRGVEHRIILRRRGTTAQQMVGGVLWAPYTVSDEELLATVI